MCAPYVGPDPMTTHHFGTLCNVDAANTHLNMREGEGGRQRERQTGRQADEAGF